MARIFIRTSGCDPLMSYRPGIVGTDEELKRIMGDYARGFRMRTQDIYYSAYPDFLSEESAMLLAAKEWELYVRREGLDVLLRRAYYEDSTVMDQMVFLYAEGEKTRTTASRIRGTEPFVHLVSRIHPASNYAAEYAKFAEFADKFNEVADFFDDDAPVDRTSEDFKESTLAAISQIDPNLSAEFNESEVAYSAKVCHGNGMTFEIFQRKRGKAE